MKWLGLAARLLVILVCLLAVQEPRLPVTAQELMQGDAAFKQGQVAQAIADYRAALEAQPGDPVVLNRLIDTTLSIQRPDMAHVFLLEAVALQGWTPELARKMADVLLAEGDSKQAEAFLQASLSGGKEDIPTLRKLADRAANQGDWESAKATLYRMLTLDPTSEQVQYQLGLSLLPDHVTTALSYLDAAAVDPEYRASATAIRATITSHVNDVPAALSFQIALTLMSLKAWPYAEHAIIISMRQGPSTAAGLALLGMAQDQQGRDGWPLLERAYNADSADSMVNYAMALHWRLTGDTKKALAALARAEALDAQNPAIAAEIGLVYRMEGRLDSAALWLNVAATLAPNNQSFRTLLATFYADTGYNLTGGGLDVIRRIADKSPNDVDIRASLGWALFSTGEIDAARVELERALVLDPTNARARYYFAILLEYRGDIEGAINSYLYVYRDAADNGFKDLASGALTRLGYNVDPDKAQR